jgi:hypothetical protein
MKAKCKAEITNRKPAAIQKVDSYARLVVSNRRAPRDFV